VKDFDSERLATDDAAKRQFRLGGETFVRVRGVRPEALLSYEELEEGTPAKEALPIIDNLIMEMIENHDGSHDRWVALRERRDDPVTIEDMQELVKWLLEEVTGRTPTQPSSPSTPGRRRTTTPSTAASSSRGGKKASAT
jgi:hypothetical protein